MPMVSILLPIYNNVNDVNKAIQSVLDQTFRDWELIILDDGSTDGLENIMKSFLACLGDSRIKFIRFMKNRGVYVCLNEGLLRARGRYITRIDSDDTIDKKKLEKQVEILEKNPKIQVVQVKYKRAGGTSGFGEVTLMYRKSIIDRIGYYDSVRFSADTEFMDRIIKVYGLESVNKLDEVLYYSQKRPNSLTTSKITGFIGTGRQVRWRYCLAYNKWHHQNQKLYIAYPLEVRPFPVDALMLPTLDMENLLALLS